MAEIIALDPPIDAVVEEENVGFDFGQVLDPAVAIVAIAAMNIYVIEGADPTPGMRILGSPLIVASPTTGVPTQCVIQRFGPPARCDVECNRVTRRPHDVGSVNSGN